MVGEELGLRELNEIARKEKSARLLLPLSKSFYTQCQDYVESLDTALAEEEKSVGQNPKALMFREELVKARSKIASIFSMRQRKILLLSYQKSSGAGGEVNIEPLTEEERLFFEEVLEVLSESRNTILGSSHAKKKKLRTLFTRRANKAEAELEPEVEEPAPPAPLPIESPLPIEDTAPASPPPMVNEPDMATVVVLEEIPPLMGPEAVYELSPQDIATLPRTMAELLEKQGKVRLVERS